MPNVQAKWDAQLIDWFLSVYDGGTWASGLSIRDEPERWTDGAVEIVAKRISDGATLAIEHTLVEPFVGDTSDFHGPFKFFQDLLRKNDSLRIPGFWIHIDVPVGALPAGSDWRGVAADVASWLRAEYSSFTTHKSERRCPSPHHPNGQLALLVTTTPLGDMSRAVPLTVHRYGPTSLDASVEKALRRKLPKLVKIAVDRRILMLERDQGGITPDDVIIEIERRHDEFPDLAQVNEIWIADTLSWEPKGRWVAFSWRGPSRRETFEFYDGVLFASYLNGMPVRGRP